MICFCWACAGSAAQHAAPASAAPMNRRRTIDRTTESSSGKIRQSSYNHAESRQAAGVQDPAARRAAQALAGPVRAARRADQERTPRAGRTLPTEQALTRAAGVSRTVVREAVAALRAEGLVIT